MHTVLRDIRNEKSTIHTHVHSVCLQKVFLYYNQSCNPKRLKGKRDL